MTLGDWLEATRIGVFVRESLYGFPALVAVHILSLVCSAGVVIWFDLRLLGVAMTRVPVSRVYRRLMPWAFCGFAAMFASGGALVIGFASAAFKNPYFLFKMSAILLAGVNAAVYHTVTERGIARWDTEARTPVGARLAGLFSVLLWCVVILAGRMMSYTLYSP